MQMCCVAECGEPAWVKCRQLCRRHYHRWRRHGDPLQAKYDRVDGPPIDRWWAKVAEDANGCWLWQGTLDHHGYGQFHVIVDGERRNLRAHRWGYQHFVRTLDRDEVLDHLCRIRQCVNPDHLDPVSHLENVRRGNGGQHNAVKTHCPRGHEYDGVTSRGRFCRTCQRDGSRETQRRRRGYKGNPPNGDKTHCKNGHEFTVENTIVRGLHRQCRECARAATREYMRRQRAAPS